MTKNTYIIFFGQFKGFPGVILVICHFYMSYEIQLHYYVLSAFHTSSHLNFVSIHFTEEQFKTQGVSSKVTELEKSRFLNFKARNPILWPFVPIHPY